MHRRRVGACVVGIAAAAGLLTACSKPTPELTFLSGSTVTQVSAQTYCFDANPNHCRIGTNAKTTRLKAVSGSSIMIDVPRVVAGRTWQASAYTVEADGKPTPISDATASSPVVHGHSTRVQVPVLTGDASYLLAVQSKGLPGSWIAQVDVVTA
jgi:hypothetical protein